MLKNLAAVAITALALLGLSAGTALAGPATSDTVVTPQHRTSPVH